MIKILKLLRSDELRVTNLVRLGFQPRVDVRQPPKVDVIVIDHSTPRHSCRRSHSQAGQFEQKRHLVVKKNYEVVEGN